MNALLRRCIGLLKKNQDVLKEEFHVEKIGIFGSISRGDAGKKSDIDIIVEFSKSVGLIHFITLENWLSALLGRKVDLATPGALKPLIKEGILKDTVYV